MSGTATAGTWFRPWPEETARRRAVRAQRCPCRRLGPLLYSHVRNLVPAVSLLDEELAEELRAALGAAADEADDGVADLDVAPVSLEVEDPREGLRLPGRVVGLQVQLRQLQLLALREKVLDPLARRMELEPVAGVRGDEGAPTPVLLHPQLVPLGPLERGLELGLVEHEPQMVDPRRRPLAGLDDDVDRALLELGQPE